MAFGQDGIGFLGATGQDANSTAATAGSPRRNPSRAARSLGVDVAGMDEEGEPHRRAAPLRGRGRRGRPRKTVAEAAQPARVGPDVGEAGVAAEEAGGKLAD